MSKNQIWILIGIIVIGGLVLISDTQIKIEVRSSPNYETHEECYVREVQQCTDSSSKGCLDAAWMYCESLNLKRALSNS